MSEPAPGSDQQRVLQDIRRALGRSEAVKPAPLESFIEASAGRDSEEVVALFTREATAVGGHVHLAHHGEDVAARIAQVCHEAGVSEVAMSGAPILAEMNLPEQLEARGLVVVADFAAHEHEKLIARLASCGAGVTAIDYAIAETGTVVVSSDEEQALLVSLLPPIHIAVLREQQINDTLNEVVGQLKAERMGRDAENRAATFITGPSRTSDVELVLSIGVHGPKQLHLIIMDERE